MEGIPMRYVVTTTCALVALAGVLGATTTDLSPDPSDTPPPAVQVEKTAPPTPPVIAPDTVVEVDQTEVEVIPAPEPVMEEPEVMEPDPLPEPCPEKEALAEDGSCVPLDYWDTPAFREPSTNVGSWWDGLLVGDVIVCPEGYEVSIDVTPAGQVWAACM